MNELPQSWILNLLLLPPIAAASRVIATVIELVSAPRRVLRSIPDNWMRQAFATDFACSPEWLPVPRRRRSIPPDTFTEEESRVYYLLTLFGDFFPDTPSRLVRRMAGLLAVCIGTIVMLVPLVLCAFAYRWSIKSTAIVWGPLVWALWPVKPLRGNWGRHFRIQMALGIPQLIAVVSVLSIVFVASKCVLYCAQYELALSVEAWAKWLSSHGWKTGPGTLADIIVAFIRPGAFPLWHVAMAINAAIGIFLCWKIRSWLVHYKHGAPPTDAKISTVLHRSLFLRHILISYVIFCDGWIIVDAALKMPMPEFGLFPWR